jgi:DnaJ-class molecular chaperone
MFRQPSQIPQNKGLPKVEFGKRRFSMHNDRVAPPVQETCVRCFGVGRIRERGNRILCKTCAGTGRITVKTGTAAAAASSA